MRKIIIAGNWKMNKIFPEAEDFFMDIAEYIENKKLGNVEVVICPPSVYLEMAGDITADHQLFIGAQNVSGFESGAYTGELSALMFNSMELDYCIIGHSERRKYFAETDKNINEKLKILQENEIIPIVCIGETLNERESGITEKIVLNQLENAFRNVQINDNVIIAYEPVWAIGTGVTATPQQAQEIHYLIRNWFVDKYSKEVAENIPILYGGSMKPENIKELLSQQDIDGGLIGGASLDISKFSEMIDIAVEL